MNMIGHKYVAFFEELAQNNHRDWFQAEKKRYEQEVKAPFLKLVKDLKLKIQTWYPGLPEQAEACIFRINRDIRFSPDKTPYHTLLKASFVPGGKKSGKAGFHLGIGAQFVHVGGGLIQVNKNQLAQIRASMAEEPSTWNKVLEKSSFREKYTGLKGLRYKRLNAPWKAMQEQIPAIAYRQFYVMAQIPLAEHLNSPDLPALVWDHFLEVKPFVHLLNQAKL